MRTVAALYVDPNGPYPKLEGVECWDESRDARGYEGPHPVVAHPPCAPWSRMRWLCKNRSEKRDCAIRAITQVRNNGGVLEHPESTALWSALGLPRPGKSDQWGSTWYVRQVSWGHQCVKPTWIYVVGVSDDAVRAGLRFGGNPTHCVCSGPGQLVKLPVAHATMRSRSPLAFAEWLVSLARVSKVTGG